jgi:hypothetical protein
MKRVRLAATIIAGVMAVSGVATSPTTALEPVDTRSEGCLYLESLPILDIDQVVMELNLTMAVGETIAVEVLGISPNFGELIVGVTSALRDSGVVPGTLSFVVDETDFNPPSFGINNVTVQLFFREGRLTADDLETGTVDWSCEAAPTPPPPPVDSDGDGVPDNVDECPGTVADAAAVRQNRFRMNSEGDFVDSVGTIAATVADTRGCSAAQIIAAAGLGTGHTNFGITRSALDDWIAAG